jgi:hypothetical protein
MSNKDLTGEVIAFSYYGLIKTADNIEIPQVADPSRGATSTNSMVAGGCTPNALVSTSDGCGNQTSLKIGQNKAGAAICGPLLIDDAGYGKIDSINSNCRIGVCVCNGGLAIADALHVDGSTGNLTSTIKGSFCNIGSTCVTGDTNLGSGNGNYTVSCGDFFVGGTNVPNGRCVSIDAVTGNTSICGSLDVAGSTCLRGGVGIIGTTEITGNLNVSGDVTAFYSSDKRLKTDLSRIGDSSSIINSLTGYRFNWDSNKTNREGSDVGIIAQDTQKVLPVIVKEREDGYLAVDYIKLIPVLIEEVKSLNNRIVTLEDQLNN